MTRQLCPDSHPFAKALPAGVFREESVAVLRAARDAYNDAAEAADTSYSVRRRLGDTPVAGTAARCAAQALAAASRAAEAAAYLNLEGARRAAADAKDAMNEAIDISCREGRRA